MTSRQDILQEYKRLVGEYHKWDYLFEQNEDTDDDELFNNCWLRVTKSHMHMQQYAEKHKITRQEMTEATQGIRCNSVAEAMEVGHRLLEGEHVK